MYPFLSLARHSLLPAVLTAALAVAVAGCANPFSSGASDSSPAASSASAQRGPTVSDADIKASTLETFKQDPELAAAAISVSVDQGVVSLSGTVPNVQAYLRAGSLARNVPGVRPPVNVSNLQYAR